ncbi:hypothetical protein CVT26_000052 [Gymnopilus dilepis]|uniref:FAD-binding domain-containing protein n=1 Tax=Gymnopilus dilepis TaxID=231916 RepID=A0A409VGE8_9AGAR|nr:hypothetical protein CVT26_000052 [Gymnopilus dilepis]
MSQKLRIAIVGGGIGGLALAVALKHLNLEDRIQVDIYEAAAELKQIGAGITLWPRGLEILREMGLGGILAERMAASEGRELQDTIHVFRKSDQAEGVTVLDLETRGSQVFHRAELQDILLKNMSSNSIHLHPSHRLATYEERAEDVELHFKNGEKAVCDLLVGADGLNSAVRSGLLAEGKECSGEEAHEKSQPVWSGTTVYRELLDADDIKRDRPHHRSLKQLTVSLGKNKHIVAYPVSQGTFVNVVVFFPDPEKEGTYIEGPAVSNVVTHDLVAQFEGWEEDVTVIAKHMSRPSRWLLQTVKPLDKYTSRRAILIGDAAHAMEPHLANGAGQAIEDAYIFSNILAKALQNDAANLPELTRTYDAVRRPFGNFAVQASRDHGRLYDLLASGFEDVKEGEIISAEKLAELGKRIDESFAWTVSHIPGLRVPFWPLGLPGVLLPVTWWNPSVFFTWEWRHNLYKRFGHDTFSVVSFVTGPSGFYSANLDIARQVAIGGHKTSFVKPRDMSRALLLWGMNIVAADGELWRKHRRIMGPAFNMDLYQLVWQESLRMYKEMIAAEGWDGKKTIEIPVIQKLTFKFALLIIGRCGFGFDFNWFSPPRAADGSMSVLEALRIVGDSYMIAVFLPKWIQNLPFKKLKESKEAHQQMMHFMQTQVSERKAEIQSQSEAADNRHDAFTMLVKANEEQGKFKLDDQELIGNVYIMLFAGHETTAHTLAATLGFLSVHEDVQEELYQQVVSVVGHDRDPVFDDYNKLDKVLAGFYEALRLFPAGYILIREAYEDTVLHVPKPVGEEGTTTIPVPKGTQVVVDMIGAQLNPRYFDSPEEFRPSRWYGLAHDSEAFSAFSIGPRACIGRKFATVEAVCFLSMLLRDFKVQPLLQPAETVQQWKDRVLDAKIAITLGVKDVPLKFVRRA